MTAKTEVKAVKIDPSLVKADEVEILAKLALPAAIEHDKGSMVISGARRGVTRNTHADYSVNHCTRLHKNVQSL